MFLLVSVVLTDFLTTALISQCHYLAVWMEGCLKEYRFKYRFFKSYSDDMVCLTFIAMCSGQK